MKYSINALFKKGTIFFFLYNWSMDQGNKVVLIIYPVVCSDGRLRVVDTDRLNKLISKTSNTVGVKLNFLTLSLNFLTVFYNCSQHWTILPTLSIACWTATGAHSVTDSTTMHHRTSGNPSCLWPPLNTWSISCYNFL